MPVDVRSAAPIAQDRTALKVLLDEIARSLVDRPEDVSVREVQAATVVVYELSVAKSDMGKILGKQGRNLKALTTILGAVATKLGFRVILELVDDPVGRPADRT
jgi:predicted RNA-binding protein YlqC (UPF0109 family)